MAADGYGAQPERTRLAWRRTMLTLTAASLLFTQPVLTGHVDGVDVALMSGVALLWLTGLFVSHARITAMSHDRPARLRPATVLPVTGVVLLLGVAGIAAALN